MAKDQPSPFKSWPIPLIGLVQIQDLGFFSHSFVAASLPQKPPLLPSLPSLSSCRAGRLLCPSGGVAPERRADAQQPLPNGSMALGGGGGCGCGSKIHARMEQQAPQQIHGRLLADVVVGSSMASPRVTHGRAGHGCAGRASRLGHGPPYRAWWPFFLFFYLISGDGRLHCLCCPRSTVMITWSRTGCLPQVIIFGRLQKCFFCSLLCFEAV